MDNKDNFIVSKLFEHPKHGGQNLEGKSEIPKRKAPLVKSVFVSGKSPEPIPPTVHAR